MKAKEFKEILKGIDDEAEILFSSDEELNCLRADGEIARLKDEKKETYVIYGFDGSEVEW